jgi:hypothetical protein
LGPGNIQQVPGVSFTQLPPSWEREALGSVQGAEGVTKFDLDSDVVDSNVRWSEHNSADDIVTQPITTLARCGKEGRCVTSVPRASTGNRRREQPCAFDR